MNYLFIHTALLAFLTDFLFLLDPPQAAPGCITGAHMDQQQQIVVSGLYEAW